MILEYIKYEIRKFSTSFSKQYAKDKRTKTFTLEKKLKELEANANFNFFHHYLECKNNLEQTYQEKANGIKLRSKCAWYEFGEKSSEFLLNLEKQHALQNQVRTLLFDQNEIRDKNQINHQLHHFYKTLFTEKRQVQNEDITAYLNQISIPILTGEQSQTCEDSISKNEFLKALKNLSNNKSPGNDGLTKEFYETFWKDLKKPLCPSITKTFHRGELSHTQKQAVIKLIGKKDRDKKIIKNWRPISLLNIDKKLISNVLAERLKNVLPSLISSDQTAYVKGRLISEGGRLIPDVLKICDKLQIKGFLMTVDIEKAFNSINHCFLIKVLKNIV